MENEAGVSFTVKITITVAPVFNRTLIIATMITIGI
jgi:hypothetical protein